MGSRLQPRQLLIWTGWLAAIILIVFSISNFVLKNYIVSGISMEPTLHTGDVVLANKLGRTLSHLQGRSYVPKRGDLVVFKNPFYNQGDSQAFIIKRVIGLPTERVLLHQNRINVYLKTDPTHALDVDSTLQGPQGPTSGDVDITIPDDELFVVGDNRQGNNSLDSRNGMSTVPISQVEGDVIFRLWPLNHLRIF